MAAIPYNTHSEAILAYAAKDPALAALMNHQHECLEESKRLASDAQTMAENTRDEIRVLAGRIYTLTIAVVGTLFVMGVGAIATLLWAVVQHGGLRQ